MRGQSQRWMWVVAALFSAPALAYSGGVVGYSGSQSGVSCSSCHAPANVTPPTVTISGPTNLNAGATGNYTLTISGGPGVRAGMNLSVDNPNATLTAGSTASKKTADELHHASPQAFSNGSVSFPFTVKAPTAAGTIKLYAAGQSTNGANGSGGDREALTTLTITVVSANQAPTIATAASATPSTVVATTTQLSVVGADDGGEAALTYTWSSAQGPAPVAFSVNGTNAAKTTTATFSRAGSYSLAVSAKDAAGLSVTSTVNVTVNATVSSVAVSPAMAGVPTNGAQQFAASATDQFGTVISPAPTFAWTTTGGGTISTTGLFTASGTPGGPFTVTATAGGKTGTAKVSVLNGSPPVIVQPAYAASNPVTGNDVRLSALATDNGGDANLTYSWSASGPSPVTFTPNGTNAASATIATFAGAGQYTLTVTVTDKDQLTATSAVMVDVTQTATRLAIQPATATVSINGTQQLTAAATDQFDKPMMVAVAWGIEAGGTVNSSGLFRAQGVPGGPFTVTASTGPVSATAAITVKEGGAPTVALDASSTPALVSGKSAQLSVLGADDAGEKTLKYRWAGTGPSPVTFTANDTNDAKNTWVNFTAAGHYVLSVTIENAAGLTASSTIEVDVKQTPTAIGVSPSTVTVDPNTIQIFSAVLADQFGAPVTTNTPVTWTLVGNGVLATDGMFTAPEAPGGPYAVSATAEGMRASALVSVGEAAQDRVAPTLAVKLDAQTALTGKVLLAADAQDDVMMAKVEFLVDGESVGHTTVEPWQVELDTWALKNGPHQLEVIATDVAGNATRAGPIEITVSNIGGGIYGEVGCNAPGADPSLISIIALLAMALGNKKRKTKK